MLFTPRLTPRRRDGIHTDQRLRSDGLKNTHMTGVPKSTETQAAVIGPTLLVTPVSARTKPLATPAAFAVMTIASTLLSAARRSLDSVSRYLRTPASTTRGRHFFSTGTPLFVGAHK